MKTIYQCEICGAQSETESAVRECEALGRADPKVFPPIGLLVGDRCGSGLKDAPKTCTCSELRCQKGFIWVVETTVTSAHFHKVGFGVFRGNGTGDTYDLDLRPSRNFLGLEEHKLGLSRFGDWKGFKHVADWPEAKPCPAFWRAVKVLRAAGRTPTVVRNGQVVPFEDPHPHDHYQNFPIGTTVRLKPSITLGAGAPVPYEATAKIRAYIYEDQGGLQLDEPLAGMRYWNVADVEVVKAG